MCRLSSLETKSGNFPARNDFAFHNFLLKLTLVTNIFDVLKMKPCPRPEAIFSDFLIDQKL